MFKSLEWGAKFANAWSKEAYFISRREVKLHVCGRSAATDADVRAALIDRFGPGKEKAIGKKASPGPLYGIKSHMWSALALAVTFHERREEKR